MQPLEAYTTIVKPAVQGIFFGLWPAAATQIDEVQPKMLGAFLLAFSYTATPVTATTRLLGATLYSATLGVAAYKKNIRFLSAQTSLYSALTALGCIAELYSGQRIYPAVKLGVVALFTWDRYKPVNHKLKERVGAIAAISYPVLMAMELAWKGCQIYPTLGQHSRLATVFAVAIGLSAIAAWTVNKYRIRLDTDSSMYTHGYSA